MKRRNKNSNDSSGADNPDPRPLAIPTAHEPLAEKLVAELGTWFDTELERLELRFRHNWTRRSLKNYHGRK